MAKRVYINERTGATIETPCPCAGGEWRELIPPEKAKRSGKGVKNGKLRDDGGSTDTVA